MLLWQRWWLSLFVFLRLSLYMVVVPVSCWAPADPLFIPPAHRCTTGACCHGDVPCIVRKLRVMKLHSDKQENHTRKRAGQEIPADSLAGLESSCIVYFDNISNCILLFFNLSKHSPVHPLLIKNDFVLSVGDLFLIFPSRPPYFSFRAGRRVFHS